MLSKLTVCPKNSHVPSQLAIISTFPCLHPVCGLSNVESSGFGFPRLEDVAEPQVIIINCLSIRDWTDWRAYTEGKLEPVRGVLPKQG